MSKTDPTSQAHPTQNSSSSVLTRVQGFRNVALRLGCWSGFRVLFGFRIFVAEGFRYIQGARNPVLRNIP